MDVRAAFASGPAEGAVRAGERETFLIARVWQAFPGAQQAAIRVAREGPHL